MTLALDGAIVRSLLEARDSASRCIQNLQKDVAHFERNLLECHNALRAAEAKVDEIDGFLESHGVSLVEATDAVMKRIMNGE